MRGAFPVTARDRYEALHGSAGQLGERPLCASQSFRYPVSKLQPSRFKDYHKF
jgi:hypothetical protein